MNAKTFTRSFLLAFSIFTSSILLSQSVVTVMNGDWNDPNVWEPAGVPVTAQSVTVMHTLTSTVDVIVSGGISSFQINAGASVQGSEADIWMIVDSEEFINEGEVYFANFAQDTGQTENNGSMFIDDTFSSDSDEMYNMGHIEGTTFGHAGGFWNEGGGTLEFDVFAIDDMLTNEPGGLIQAGEFLGGNDWLNMIGGVVEAENFVTSESFTNDGDIYCYSWVHGEGTASGDGAICIEDCFVNSANIEGGLDICDQTDSLCDLDVGSIAGTVTFCENTPCGWTVGIPEVMVDISIYPNPTTGKITFDGIDGATPVKVLNLVGGVVLETIVDPTHATIDLSGMKPGIYLVQIGDTTRRIQLTGA